MGGVLLAAAVMASPVHQFVADRSATDKVIKLLGGEEFKEDRTALIAAAPSVVLQFRNIIDSPDTDSFHRARLYGVIAESKIDRKPFLPSAVRDLGHADVWLRMSACWFVGVTGTAADSAPLLVMLFDPKVEAVYAAAGALALIGDDRTVIALDLWLRIHRRPAEWLAGDMTIENAVIKSRDEIKVRLAAAAKAPPPPK